MNLMYNKSEYIMQHLKLGFWMLKLKEGINDAKI